MRLLLAALLAAVPTGDVSGARAKAFVAELAAGGPRVAGSPAEHRAQQLVATRLRSYGYRIVFQDVPLPHGGRSRNVVGLTDGPVRSLLVAHLDGVSAGPAANDNGSGVATLLEVARAWAARPGVLVAALGAEERVMTRSRVHLGSLRLARGLSAATRRNAVAFSLDMLGFGPTFAVSGLEPGPNRSARLALDEARMLGLHPVYRSGVDGSDHRELTRAGLPAALLEWRPDPCWHRSCDTDARVSAAKLEAAARLVLELVRTASR